MSESKRALTREEAVWDDLPPIVKPVYGIDEKPDAWWERLLYGWQHTLVDISPFVLPLAVAGALGMSAADEAQFINYCLFAMGVATLLQTTIGNRLPIIQGPSATLTGTLAPLAGQLGAAAMWGGVFVGGLLEMLVGASRVLKTLRRLFPPVVSGIVCGMIAMAGIKLLGAARGTTADFLVAGTTLIGAILVPLYVQHSLGDAWLATLPTLLSLTLTNTVVLAVLLAVGLNLLLNIVLKGEAEDADDAPHDRS